MGEETIDSIVQRIIERFTKRAKFGFKKYGTTLDRTDLSPRQWATHLGEELHDALLYSEKLKEEQEKQERLIELLLRIYEGQPYNAIQKLELTNLINWYKEHTDYEG